MTEEQRRDLIKKAFEMKQELRQKLNDTENILKAKTEELEMLRLKLDRNSLMVEGEEEAMRGDKIKYFQLYPQRNFKEESAAEIHFRLAGKLTKRLGHNRCHRYKMSLVPGVLDIAAKSPTSRLGQHHLT